MGQSFPQDSMTIRHEGDQRNGRCAPPGTGKARGKEPLRRIRPVPLSTNSRRPPRKVPLQEKRQAAKTGPIWPRVLSFPLVKRLLTHELPRGSKEKNAKRYRNDRNKDFHKPRSCTRLARPTDCYSGVKKTAENVTGKPARAQSEAGASTAGEIRRASCRERVAVSEGVGWG